MSNRKNGRATRASCGSVAVPTDLVPFSEPFLLLPGEDLREFEAIRQMMVDDYTGNQYRMAVDIGSRRTLLGNLALSAPQDEDSGCPSCCCDRMDGEGMPAEVMPMVRVQARRTATEWRDDPVAAAEIEARLGRSGFDQIDINAEAYVQARELFDMFDQLMHAAQHRRIGLLREIGSRREYLKRAKRFIDGPNGT